MTFRASFKFGPALRSLASVGGAFRKRMVFIFPQFSSFSTRLLSGRPDKFSDSLSNARNVQSCIGSRLARFPTFESTVFGAAHQFANWNPHHTPYTLSTARSSVRYSPSVRQIHQSSTRLVSEARGLNLIVQTDQSSFQCD